MQQPRHAPLGSLFGVPQCGPPPMRSSRAAECPSPEGRACVSQQSCTPFASRLCKKSACLDRTWHLMHICMFFCAFDEISDTKLKQNSIKPVCDVLQALYA